MDHRRKKKVYLIRHGLVESAYHGRFTGSTDVSLCESGRKQAFCLAEKIQTIKPDLCFCSPLHRVKETAQRAMASCETEIQYDKDLREIDFGQWEGKTFDEIERRYPQEVTKWSEFSSEFSFPDGESFKAFLDRVKRFATRVEGAADHAVVVFTHGGVIRSLICYWLNLPPRNYILFDIRPASITLIELYGNRGILAGLDNSCNEVME